MDKSNALFKNFGITNENQFDKCSINDVTVSLEDGTLVNQMQEDDLLPWAPTPLYGSQGNVTITNKKVSLII